MSNQKTGKRWTLAALKREPAVQKVVDRLELRLMDMLGQQQEALATDDEKGKCASYHRGNINAIMLALREVYSYRATE